MKKYASLIIIPLFLSVAGHSLFFGIFRAAPAMTGRAPLGKDSPAGAVRLFLMTSEASAYLRAGRESPGTVAVMFPASLEAKNPLWKDSLDMISPKEPVNFGIPDREFDYEDIKKINFSQIRVPAYTAKDPGTRVRREIIPRIADIFTMDPAYRPEDTGEYAVLLKNGINMKYFVQGPAASRMLDRETLSGKEVRMDRRFAKLKLRFWISRDGKVNQVIVEESSSLPVLDNAIADLVKSLRFNPVYGIKIPNYQWGVLWVKLQK